MLTIWSNFRLPESAQALLTAGISPHRLLFSPQRNMNLVAASPDPLLADADIAFGQPDPNQLLTLTGLKWIHLTTAGYTRYDRTDLREHLSRHGTLLTNSSSVFDESCAQHALAFMLASARQLPAAMANQLGPRAWPDSEIRVKSELLSDQSALLLGFGAIARRLAELLRPFHMRLRAVRRTPEGNEPIPAYPMSDIDSLLPEVDHVINILPASPATDRFMTAKRFALMKPGSIFYNIGRGSTIDQSALIESLKSNHLSAAYLDVTDPEPLPPDHPLWTTPNCHITPHTAGGHSTEFTRSVEHFLANLKLFESNSRLAIESSKCNRTARTLRSPT